MRAPKSLGLWLVAAAACGTTAEVPAAPIERRDYILAHAHGWVEVSVLDLDVPSLRQEVTNADTKQPEVVFVRPDSCSVSILLDREDFVSGSDVFPVGESAPYEVSTGFRFPAPVGPATLTLRYRGCDVNEKGERSSTALELPVRVLQDQVSEIHFDGSTLVADPPRPDPVISIDDVYEAVTGRRKPALPD
jgi:hypothetical protein